MGTGEVDRPFKLLYVLCLVGLVVNGRRVVGFQRWNVTPAPDETRSQENITSPLVVGLTLIQSASAKGAVCLDGTLPGYHLHGGYGSGANKWLVQLEGGGWCSNTRECVFRKTTRHGSSKHMEELIPFAGILSNKPEENPDFYNWNRVKIRYCDGASFSGEGDDEAHGLFFRGQRIWVAAMEELMPKGMSCAEQALLSGCSAGGLSAIIHCDEFRSLFPASTNVKCLSDAGLFLDVADVRGAHVLKSIFAGVVTLQGVAKNLPQSCSSIMDSSLCFFPQNLINHIQTPLFLLNSAYDLWQLMVSVVPPSADTIGNWSSCKRNYSSCSAEQIAVLQGFRNQMLNAVELFSSSRQNGLFINSCFIHCQSENQSTWFANDSPVLKKKRIAQAVGDWFFDRGAFKETGCPYPCDSSCFQQSWANHRCSLLFINFFIVICGMVLAHT